MSTDKTEFTVDYSILKLPAGEGREHIILITRSLKTSSFFIQNADHQAITLDLLATYIDGPMPSDKISSGFISRMGGHVDTLGKKVKLTNGAVEVLPGMRGLGIGTFLFNYLVCWAKEQDPGFEVVPIKVSSPDVTESNQKRRNLFCAHFGFLFSDSPTNEGVVGGCPCCEYTQKAVNRELLHELPAADGPFDDPEYAGLLEYLSDIDEQLSSQLNSERCYVGINVLQPNVGQYLKELAGRFRSKGPEVESIPLALLITLHNQAPIDSSVPRTIIAFIKADNVLKPRQHWMGGLYLNDEDELCFDEGLTMTLMHHVAGALHPGLQRRCSERDGLLVIQARETHLV